MENIFALDNEKEIKLWRKITVENFDSDLCDACEFLILKSF